MRALLIYVVFSVLGLALVFGGPGCGGGGGGAGPPGPGGPNALFVGPYGMAMLTSNVTPPAGASWGAAWGTADADGAGAFTATLWSNTRGTVSGPVVDGQEYTLDAARVWSWRHPVLPGQDLMQGGISADGSVVAAGTHRDLLAPAWMMLVRRGGAVFSNASLVGRYRVASILWSAAAGTCRVHHGYIDFDGLGPPGAVSGVLRYNEGGSISAPGPVVATYTVSTAGAVTVDFPGGLSLEGTLLVGGNLLVLSGFDSAVLASPWAMVLVRQTAGVTDATVTGDYFALGYSERLFTGNYVNQTGTMTSNAAGGLTISWIEHEEGSAVTVASAATYATMPDGRVFITKSGGETLEGGVSIDGRFLVVSGGRIATEDPEMWFLFR